MRKYPRYLRARWKTLHAHHGHHLVKVGKVGVLGEIAYHVAELAGAHSGVAMMAALLIGTHLINMLAGE